MGLANTNIINTIIIIIIIIITIVIVIVVVVVVIIFIVIMAPSLYSTWINCCVGYRLHQQRKRTVHLFRLMYPFTLALRYTNIY